MMFGDIPQYEQRGWSFQNISMTEWGKYKKPLGLTVHNHVINCDKRTSHDIKPQMCEPL